MKRTAADVSKPVLEAVQNPSEHARRLTQERWLAWVGLGTPLLLALLFFYGVGRDRYQVRSDVVVRKAGQDSTAAGLSLGNLLGGGNLSLIHI